MNATQSLSSDVLTWAGRDSAPGSSSSESTLSFGGAANGAIMFTSWLSLSSLSLRTLASGVMAAGMSTLLPVEACRRSKADRDLPEAPELRGFSSGGGDVAAGASASGGEEGGDAN